MPTCSAFNDALNLRCDRDPDHIGAHIQFDTNGMHAWGFALEPSCTSP